MTRVSIDAVHRLSKEPNRNVRSGFLSLPVSPTLTATNFKMRYWVMTLVTMLRDVWLSNATSGMRRALDLSILRHASYSGLSGSIETVSGGTAPIARSTSAYNLVGLFKSRWSLQLYHTPEIAQKKFVDLCQSSGVLPVILDHIHVVRCGKKASERRRARIP